MEEIHMLAYKDFLESINFGDRQPKQLPLLGLLINNVYTILGAMGGKIAVNPQGRMFVDNINFLINILNECDEISYATQLQQILDDSNMAALVQ